MELSEVTNVAFRKGLLRVTSNRHMTAFVSRHGMNLGASRFVVGENLDEAVVNLHRLNNQGFRTNTTIFGEHIQSPDDAKAIANEYSGIVRRLAEEGLPTNIALKPTHIGLDVGEDIAFENAKQVAVDLEPHGKLLRMDMESSAYVDPTLSIYRRLRSEGIDNAGVVLQSYLYRSEKDLESLLPLDPNIRLVKGAYLEPEDVAFPQKKDVDKSYVQLAERALGGGGYTAIATHDPSIIEHVISYCGRHKIERNRFEFQMLYGVAVDLQRDLLNKGYSVLVSTNYGNDWYPYFMRRLAERPANLLFILRNTVPTRRRTTVPA